MNNIDTQLTQLETAQLVRRIGEEEATYMFKHALTQDAAYQSLLHTQRREIHRRVAQAYEAEYGDTCLDDYAGILAKHYTEAGDDEQALIYATHAGDLAARVYANAEAVAFYTQALDAAKRINATTAQFIHLYTTRGRADELAGDYVRAVENYIEMQTYGQTKGDRVLELESLMLQGTAYAIGLGDVRDPQKAQAFSMQALALANELGDRKAEARIYWNLLLNNRFGNEGPAKAVEYGEKSLALARELELTEQIALTLKDLNVAYVVVGRLESAYANVPVVIALWRQLNNLPMLAEVLGGSSQSFFAQGKLDDSIKMGEESYRLNKSIGNRYGLCVTGSFLWYSYRELGQLQQAIETAEESIAIGEDIKFVGPQWGALVELAATFDWLGDYARATEYAQRAFASIAPNTATHPVFPSAVLASVALHQGNLSKAKEWLAPFSIDSLDALFQINIFGAIRTVSVIIELALAQGDANYALPIVDKALVMVRTRGLSIGFSHILHLQAKTLRMLNRVDEAHTLLIEACQQAESMQLRYRLLPMLFTLIEMKTERGDDDAVNKARSRAREIIDYIAAHTPPSLRESFLNLADVRQVMKTKENIE